MRAERAPRVRQVAIAAGALAMLIGGGHVVAWIAGLRPAHPAATIFMKTNAGVALVLCGLALVLIARPAPPAIRRRLSAACAVAALLLGAATFSEHLVGWNLGIDQLLAVEQPGAAGTVSPNRMGLPASLSFILLGTSLLLLARSRGTNRHRALHQPGAFVVVLVGLLSIIGYLYGVSALYQISRVTAVAWPTALSLLLLAVGILCAEPQEGLMARITADDPGGAIARALLGPMVLLPLLFGWVRLTGERRHWFDAAMGTGLMMLLFMVIFSSLLLFASRRVSLASAAMRDSEQETRRQKDLLAVTLASIGDAVIVTDVTGAVTFLNGEAERLTGWTDREARTRPLIEVFRIVNEETRQGVENPVEKVLRVGQVVGLANHTVLIARDGRETPIDDSGAPIRQADGEVRGVVLVFRDITARKRAEEALRESQDRFRVAQELSPDGFLIFSPLRDDSGIVTDFLWIYENDAAARMNDTNPKEVCGKKVSEVLPHHDQSPFHTAYKEVAETGEVRVVEECSYGEDTFRQRRWFRAVAVPIGADVAILVQDLTARKQAEEALRESEQRLRLATEAAKIGTFDWDIETGVNVWTPELEEMYGLAPGEFRRTQPGWEALVHPEDRATAVSKVDETLATGEPVEGEWRVIWPDGSVHWLAGRFQGFKDAAGKPLRLTGINIDITERKRAEDERRESAEKYRQLFESMLEGFAYCRMLFDDDRRATDFIYLDVNDAFVRLTGLEHVVGKRVTEVIPRIRETNPEVFEIYGRVAETGKPEHFEIYVVGLARWLSISVYSPRKDHFVAVFDNITDRKRAEEEIKEANLRLIDADRGKNQFLAVLSHELRNPLAAVRTAVHLLEHVPPGGEHANRARSVIDRQTAQLTRLVDDLLDVTRISRGKIQIQVEPVELTGLVRRTAEDHRALFATGGIDFELQVPDESLWVDGDAQRLAQALGNLLHNAAKFTQRGGRAVALVRKDDDGPEAVVTVRDSGVGISAQALPHLFQPFMQVEDTLDRARGGLGLGLALVKSLVEMHGGTVSARSAGVGLGSEFTLRLPLRSAPPVVSAVADRVSHPRRRVLIIEDNVDAAESLSVALQLGGHTVEVAYDGPEGLETARRFGPDIVLCDIGLPGMNGYEVAQALRKDRELAAVFLVALTGYALPEDVAKARDAGFDLHVPKPPSPEKLQEIFAAPSAARPRPS